MALLAAFVLAGCAAPRLPHITRTQLPAPSPPPHASEADHSTQPSIYERGDAGYYASSFAGRATTSGEPYNPHALTAAHRTLPLGTRVRVKDLDNGRHVTVRINDRGPFVDGRIIDLSRRAAKKLKMRRDGVAPVTLQVLSEPASD